MSGTVFAFSWPSFLTSEFLKIGAYVRATNYCRKKCPQTKTKESRWKNGVEQKNTRSHKVRRHSHISRRPSRAKQYVMQRAIVSWRGLLRLFPCHHHHPLPFPSGMVTVHQVPNAVKIITLWSWYQKNSRTCIISRLPIICDASALISSAIAGLTIPGRGSEMETHLNVY